MADPKRRVEKLETEGRNITEGRGFRMIVSDPAREPLPSDDICIRAITEEWLSWAAAAFVIQVIRLGEIPIMYLLKRSGGGIQTPVEWLPLPGSKGRSLCGESAASRARMSNPRNSLSDGSRGWRQ
jgi:hypothetical protein